MNNLGRLVKRKDAQQGWHTGREVMLPFAAQGALSPATVVIQGEDYALYPNTLIQESCTKELTWVLSDLLSEWETREQRAERGEE